MYVDSQNNGILEKKIWSFLYSSVCSRNNYVYSICLLNIEALVKLLFSVCSTDLQRNDEIGILSDANNYKTKFQRGHRSRLPNTLATHFVLSERPE